MINIKENVVFHPLTWNRPEMWDIIEAVINASPEDYVPTITSGCEGSHSTDPWSKHYTGWALDFRIRDFPIDKDRWVIKIEIRLGSKYFVLLEKCCLHIHYKDGG